MFLPSKHDAFDAFVVLAKKVQNERDLKIAAIRTIMVENSRTTTSQSCVKRTGLITTSQLLGLHNRMEWLSERIEC